MRVVFGLVLVIGVGLAGFAVYMARDFISAQQAQLAAERAAQARAVPTVDVIVLTEPARYGQKITAESVRKVRWPQDAVPEGTFHSLADLFPEGQPQFRTTLRAMEKDEAVLAVKVTPPGQDAGVGARLRKGMRAFAIRVDVASGVSGFVRPGDLVDIYWTGRAAREEGAGARDVTQLIETNVPVMAIDQTADADQTAPTVARTVTVEVTPQQVAALAQAQATGRLALSLVGESPDETVARGAIEIDQNALLGIEAAAPIEAMPEKKVCTIRTRRGAELIQTEIPCPAK